MRLGLYLGYAPPGPIRVSVSYVRLTNQLSDPTLAFAGSRLAGGLMETTVRVPPPFAAVPPDPPADFPFPVVSAHDLWDGASCDPRGMAKA